MDNSNQKEYSLVAKIKTGERTTGYVIQSKNLPQGMTNNVTTAQMIELIEAGKVENCKVQNYGERKIVRGTNGLNMADLLSYQYSKSEVKTSNKEYRHGSTNKRPNTAWTLELFRKYRVRKADESSKPAFCYCVYAEVMEYLEQKLRANGLDSREFFIDAKMISEPSGEGAGRKDFELIIIMKDKYKNMTAASVMYYDPCIAFIELDQQLLRKRINDNDINIAKKAKKILDYIKSEDEGIDLWKIGDKKNQIIRIYRDLIIAYFEIDLGLNLK